MAITMKRIRHNIEYSVIRILIFLLNLAPYKLALYFGDFIGILAFSVLRIRRKITLDNLRNSFANKYSERELAGIGSRAYRNFAKSMIEYGLFPKLKKKDLNKFVSIEGLEHLINLRDKKSGAVMVTGHFGSWELMGAYISRQGFPIDYLVGEQHNLEINRLMNNNRQMFGIGLIEMGVAARGVIKAVKTGRMVAMLSDQDAGSDGAIVRFMGRPASTPKGPAAFAIKTGVPMIFGVAVRQGKKHVIHIEPPIEFKPSGNKDDDIKNLTQAYTSLLGKYIEIYPDHWFWPHRRWKSTS